MKVAPLDRQSILDLAIQTSGSVEAAFSLSVVNDISVSDAIAQNTDIETVSAVDRSVLSRYQARKIRPASEISSRDAEAVPYGGIGFMGIEIDFIIS